MAATSQRIAIEFPESLAHRRGWVREARSKIARNPVGAVAGLSCVLLVLVAIWGPLLAPHSAAATDFPRLQSPSWSYPFGTDNLFRDMFSRIIFGARTTIGIGFTALLIATLLSVGLGITSGYLGGNVDLFVSRLMDVTQAYPGIVFAIFFLSIFTPTFLSVSIAVGILLTPAATRIVRGATIGVRHMPYVEAAVAVGDGPVRIMFRHVLPNVMPSIIITASIQIGLALLIETSLSFIGLGISSASHPSWGRMLQETRPVWQIAWWTAVVPGLAISVAVLSFNLFGDALRDWLDPRLRGSR